MPKNDNTALIAEARAALCIQVPIYRVEVDGDKVTFWLYGRHKPETYTRPQKTEPKADTKPKKTTRRRTTKKQE
jgi:hypothetical protein